MGFNVVVWSAASVTAMISGRWVTPLTPPSAYLQFFAGLWWAKRLSDNTGKKWGGVRADGVGLSLSSIKVKQTASGHRLAVIS